MESIEKLVHNIMKQASNADSVYTNVNLCTGEAANQFDTEVALNPFGSGKYVMLICANGDCAWEIHASE